MLFVDELADFGLQIQILVGWIDRNSAICQGILINLEQLKAIPDERIVETITRNRQSLIQIFFLVIIPLEGFLKSDAPLFEYLIELFSVVLDGESNAD